MVSKMSNGGCTLGLRVAPAPPDFKIFINIIFQILSIIDITHIIISDNLIILV